MSQNQRPPFLPSNPLQAARWTQRFTIPSEEEVSLEVQVFDIPAAGPTRDEFLLAITHLTGFPIDFSKRAIECAGEGFLSVRTSAESIPRGSFAVEGEDDEVLIAADYKTPGVGSKSKLRGMGKGKLLMDPIFFDIGRELSKVQDPKDNNSLSRFPDRLLKKMPESKESELFKQLQLYQPDLHEIRLDANGLIYCSIDVPVFDGTKLDASNKKPKHFCQEVELLASILYNLDKGIYYDARIENKLLYFLDDKLNECRIDLTKLIPPVELKSDQKVKAALEQLAKITNVTALKTFLRLTSEKDPEVGLALKCCHAPVFVKKEIEDAEVFVPVLLQSGDNGEAIIRDADIEHFNKPQGMPILAARSFNGGKINIYPHDHIAGLQLYMLRLNSKTKKEFEENLVKFIEDAAEYTKHMVLEPNTLKELLDKVNIMFKDFLANPQNSETKSKFEFIMQQSPINFEEIKLLKPRLFSTAMQKAILLAKYHDLSILSKDSPYVDYTGAEFADARKVADEAYKYYLNNRMLIGNAGESSTHDLIALYQLSHPMAMHGDEGGHPKGKPEDFARITIYCNNKIIITSDEDQYLKILMNNPEMLEQIITIHPYWMRQDASRSTVSQAWIDLLTIQALRYGMIVSNSIPSGGAPTAGFDIFVESALLNLSRRFLKKPDETGPGDQAMIDKVRKKLKEHFAEIKLNLGSSNPDWKGMIDTIYANSTYKLQGAELAKYRVYAGKLTLSDKL